MASNNTDQLQAWLATHDNNIERFKLPVSMEVVSDESSIDGPIIERILGSSDKPIFHTWSNTYAGKASRTKPYCLRLNGPGTVGLDWEDSVVGAAAADFQRCGYDTAIELGTSKHIVSLKTKPNVEGLMPGVNQRDLWASKKLNDGTVDFWIIEAKGKEAAGFERYCFAESLSQIYEIPGVLLSTLLGSPKKTSHGLCYRFADELHAAWKSADLKVMVNLAVLIPHWAPDIVWSSGEKLRPKSYYHDPLHRFQRFLESGESGVKDAKFKGEKAFCEMLDYLESKFQIRSMWAGNSRIRHRTLTATCVNGKFKLVHN